MPLMEVPWNSTVRKDGNELFELSVSEFGNVLLKFFRTLIDHSNANKIARIQQVFHP